MLKEFIIKLERMIFKGAALNVYAGSRQPFLRRKFESLFEFRFVVHYHKDNLSLLSTLCERYGSDKGSTNDTGHPYPWPANTYADFYSLLFDHSRLGIKKVFECGLGTNNPDLPSSMGKDGKPGASLRVWRDYFPNAHVYGADIDRSILFEEHRIKTSYLDQTDQGSIAEYWNTLGVDRFDLMIDDGLHTFDAGVCLFESSISKLAREGIYVIEDVSLTDMLRYQNYFSGKPYKVKYVSLFRPARTLTTTSLVVVWGAAAERQ